MSQPKKRSGLGRGLAALIPTGAPEDGQQDTSLRMGSAAADVLIGGGPAAPVNGAVAAESAAAARAEAEAIGAVYREIEPSAIQPNPRQPRSVFDADAQTNQRIRQAIGDPFLTRNGSMGHGCRMTDQGFNATE